MGVDVFGFAGDLLDHGAEENEPDVGVVEELSGIEIQPRVECATDSLRFVGLLQPPWAVQAQISGKARGVCQQHAQRHLRPSRVIGWVELGQVGLQGFIDRDLALLGELQNSSCRREALRHRCQIEDCVLGHGFRRCGGAVESRFAVKFAGSECLTEDDLAGVADLDDGAGHPRCRNRIFDELCDGREITVGHHGCGHRWRRGSRCGC